MISYEVEKMKNKNNTHIPYVCNGLTALQYNNLKRLINKTNKKQAGRVIQIALNRTSDLLKLGIFLPQCKKVKKRDLPLASHFLGNVGYEKKDVHIEKVKMPKFAKGGQTEALY